MKLCYSSQGLCLKKHCTYKIWSLFTRSDFTISFWVQMSVLFGCLTMVFISFCLRTLTGSNHWLKACSNMLWCCHQCMRKLSIVRTLIGNHHNNETMPGKIPTSNMTQKLATASKMKSPQKTIKAENEQQITVVSHIFFTSLRSLKTLKAALRVSWSNSYYKQFF